MISGGTEQATGKMFRIGHIGLTAAPGYVLPTVLALERALIELASDSSMAEE